MAAIAAAAPYLAAAGAAVSAIGAIQQGQSARAAARYNAKMAEDQAAQDRYEASVQAQQKARETYQRLGAIRAAQGKSGGAADAGSVLDVIGDVASQGELERQWILRGGEISATGRENTARLDRMQGRAAVTGSYLKAGSELLSGTSNAYYTWKRS